MKRISLLILTAVFSVAVLNSAGYASFADVFEGEDAPIEAEYDEAPAGTDAEAFVTETPAPENENTPVPGGPRAEPKHESPPPSAVESNVPDETPAPSEASPTAGEVEILSETEGTDAPDTPVADPTGDSSTPSETKSAKRTFPAALPIICAILAAAVVFPALTKRKNGKHIE